MRGNQVQSHFGKVQEGGSIQPNYCVRGNQSTIALWKGSRKEEALSDYCVNGNLVQSRFGKLSAPTNLKTSFFEHKIFYIQKTKFKYFLIN